jgi:acetyl-CoA acetyltransferase
VGATGVAQVVEAFEQLTRRAGKRQADAKRALCHNIGGLGNNVLITLLEVA